MAKPGKGRAQISVTMPQNLIDVIDERRGDLDWSRSEFALKVLEKWRSESCPSVSPADHALQVLKGKESKKK